jgi:hypothetical protein
MSMSDVVPTTTEQEVITNLNQAFAHVEHAKAQLGHIEFPSPIWKDAYEQTFDQIMKLKGAPPLDASTLGLVFIDVIGGLNSQIGLKGVQILFASGLTWAQWFFRQAKLEEECAMADSIMSYDALEDPTQLKSFDE